MSRRESYLKHREAAIARAKRYAEENREAVRAYKRAHYLANREKLIARQRDYRQANIETIRARDRIYKQTEAGKKSAQRSIQRAREKYPEKYKARMALWNAISAGTVAAPDACEHCGSASRLHGHHVAYDSPLLVTWLCRPCHTLLHKELNLRAQEFYAAGVVA